VIVTRLELFDFRNYEHAELTLDPGVTAVIGRNGQGKTNLAEALAFLSTLDSFRGAPSEALIRVGAEHAILRATVHHDDGRDVLVELELTRHGRNRAQVNRQRLARTRDLLGVMRVTVFSPDDLELVKGSPGDRRRFLDDTLVALAVKYDAVRLEYDRILKQRNVLLKQAGGRLDEAAAITLDVWDAKMADVGDRYGHARAVLVARLAPLVADAYEHLAGTAVPIELRYEPGWRSRGLAPALVAARTDDVRRGQSSVGPHRDDVEVVLAGMPARTHASQGEQRSVALALKLAAHRLVADKVGSAPLLVLDDVLSELDDDRAAALLGHLPPGQVVLTTATELPPAARPDHIVRIEGAKLQE
jgi:DNA replication and repair protein RecF